MAVEELPGATGGLVQYGALGVIASLGLWFMWRAYRRECERGDRLEAENKALNEAIVDKVMPVLLSSSRAVEESTEMLRGEQNDRRMRWARDRQEG